MVNGLEKWVELQVCEYAERKGCEVLKLNVKGRVGWPDRLFIYQGKVLFIEFKRIGETPTVLQQSIHNLLRNQLMRVEVVDDAYKGRKIIDEFADRG